MLTQPNGAAVWSEELGTASALAISEAGYRKDAGYWEPVVVTPTVPTHGRALDVGEGYSLFDVSEPWIFASDGAGGLELAPPGTPAAGHMVDDGAGGLLVSTDMTIESAGQAYPDTTGGVHPVRSDAPELHLMKIGDAFITYE
jgi:hypothetical protein